MTYLRYHAQWRLFRTHSLWYTVFYQCAIDDVSDFKVVLRELFINAVEHGNGHDAKKTILVELMRVNDREIRLVLEDEGNGFDHDKLDTNLSRDPRKRAKRGFALIELFSNQLKFNEQGNRITAYLRYPQGRS